MIIVEGTDCVGKTTFCHQLVVALNERDELINSYTYAHLSRLPRGWNKYWSYEQRMCRRVVQDRFHASEIAYSIARGDEPLLDEFSYEFVDCKFRLLGGMHVLIVADEDAIRSRLSHKPDEMYDADLIIRAQDAFMCMSREGAFDFTLDVGDMFVTFDQLEMVVERYVNRQCALHQILRSGDQFRTL